MVLPFHLCINSGYQIHVFMFEQHVPLQVSHLSGPLTLHLNSSGTQSEQNPSVYNFVTNLATATMG